MGMKVIRVKLKSRGMQQMLNGGDVREELTSRMQRVLASAKADAPVETGAYRNGLHIVQATTDRAVVRVAGGTDHDLIVEAKHGILSRALDRAGGE